MHIGIDLDNTLVCYDELFWTLAVERGWIARDIPARKERVRDELRRRGREADWTLLQGEVYGSRMREATPFAGALEMMSQLRQRGDSVCIVSHRTKTPFAGPAYDLHTAAIDWLTQNGFLDQNATGLCPQTVYLETMKADKLARISSLNLSWFIDDLPELLMEPMFPSRVRRMLFDPHHHRPALPQSIVIAHDWRAIPDQLVEGGL